MELDEGIDGKINAINNIGDELSTTISTVLRLTVLVRIILCAGVLCGGTHVGDQTTQIRNILYLRISHIYGIIWNNAWPSGTCEIHVTSGSFIIYIFLFRFDVLHLVLHFLHTWCDWIPLCRIILRNTTCRTAMVPY